MLLLIFHLKWSFKKVLMEQYLLVILVFIYDLLVLVGCEFLNELSYYCVLKEFGVLALFK